MLLGATPWAPRLFVPVVAVAAGLGLLTWPAASDPNCDPDNSEVEIVIGYLGPYLGDGGICTACTAGFLAALEWLNTPNGSNYLKQEGLPCTSAVNVSYSFVPVIADSAGSYLFETNAVGPEYHHSQEVGYKTKALYHTDKMMADRSCSNATTVNPVGDNVVIQIAGWYSSTARVTGMLATIHSVPMIGAGPTADDLSDKSKYPLFSRVITPDKFQAPFLAAMVKNIGWKNVGVAYVGNDIYGSGMMEAFVKACEDLGVNVPVTASYSAALKYPTTINASNTAVQRLKDSGITVFLLACSSADSAMPFLQAARDANLTGPGFTWIAPDGWSGVTALAYRAPCPDETPTTNILCPDGSARPSIAELTRGGLAMFPFVPKRQARVMTDRAYELIAVNPNWIATARELDKSAELVNAGCPGNHSCTVLKGQPKPPFNPWGYFTWDAGLAAARSAVLAGPRCRANGWCLTQKIRNDSFMGATGSIQFDISTGDRKPLSTGGGSFSVSSIRVPTVGDPNPSYQVGFVSGDPKDSAKIGPGHIVVNISMPEITWSDNTNNRPSDGIEVFELREGWDPEQEKDQNDGIRSTYRIGELVTIPGPGKPIARLFTGFTGTSDKNQLSYELDIKKLDLDQVAERPGRFLIDQTDGQILAQPNAPGRFRAVLYGAETRGSGRSGDRRAEVWSWNFTVLEKLIFGLVPEWKVDHAANGITKYRLGHVYDIDKPELGREQLFVNPHQNDASTISFVLRIFRSTTPGTRSVCNSSGLQLLCPGDRCPGKFFVAPSGEISVKVILTGSYVAKLDAVDTAGSSVTVRCWQFEALPADTDDEENGPAGKGCGDGVKVDEKEFDGSFSCNCTATRYTGSNCELELSDSGGESSQSNGVIIGSMIAVFLALILLSFVGYKLRIRTLKRRVQNFRDMAQTMRNEGYEHIDDNKLPREVRRSTVKFVRRLGSGAFGDVWFGRLDERIEAKSADGRNTANCVIPSYPVAIKTSKEPDSEVTQEMLREATLMAQVELHDNVVSLIGVVTAGSPLLLLLSYCEQGSLLSVLKKRKRNGARAQNTIQQKVLMLIDVACGMVHLGRCSMVHRDLATRNVLLDHAEVCKVADFGLSRTTSMKRQGIAFAGDSVDDGDGIADEADEDCYYRSHGGLFPIRWTCPIALVTERFSTSSDVWSFGVLAIEVLTSGDRPYMQMSNAEVMRRVNEGYRLPKPEGCPNVLYELLLQCWSEQLHDRPTFPKILERLQIIVEQPVLRQTLFSTDSIDNGEDPSGEHRNPEDWHQMPTIDSLNRTVSALQHNYGVRCHSNASLSDRDSEFLQNSSRPSSDVLSLDDLAGPKPLNYGATEMQTSAEQAWLEYDPSTVPTATERAQLIRMSGSANTDYGVVFTTPTAPATETNRYIDYETLTTPTKSERMRLNLAPGTDVRPLDRTDYGVVFTRPPIASIANNDGVDAVRGAPRVSLVSAHGGEPAPGMKDAKPARVIRSISSMVDKTDHDYELVENRQTFESDYVPIERSSQGLYAEPV